MFSPTGIRATDPDVLDPSLFGSGIGGLLGVYDEQKSEREVEDSLLGTFYACIHIRCHTAATAVTRSAEDRGWKVMARTGDGVEPAKDSPWQQLLWRPNSHRSAYRVWYWAFMTRLLYGRASFIVGGDPVPQSLHEVYKSFGKIEAVEAQDGGVDGYIFHRRSDGGRVSLEPQDVIESVAVHPNSPYEGLSVLDALWDQVQQERHGARYMSQSLREGRPPMFYLKSDQDLTSEEMTRYGQEFSDKFLQVDRQPDFAARSTVKEVPVLGSGTSMESPSINPDDWQMIESLGLTQEMIHTVTGVPKSLYATEGGSEARDRQAYRTLIRNAVQPDITSMAHELTRGLERAFGAEEGALVVSAPSAMPKDETMQENINLKRIKRGVPPTQIMEEQGEEVPEGQEELDQSFVSSEVQPIGSAGGDSAPTSDPQDNEPPGESSLL